jgi:dTDP-4-amino-4,6-dideoxygalactose transaminase
LALFGGPPAVNVPPPHEPWPPPAGAAELSALAMQRNSDISIRGRTGPIRAFEDEFLEFLGSRRYAITYNSGTSALLAAYHALGVTEGVEVIGPALTYHAALSPVYALRGSVVLVDIDRGSRCIDPGRIEEAITERTRIITVVHQWGHPADVDRILRIVERYGLRLLEDCSHAHGSRYRGRLCGTFGHAAVFSLQANKAVFAGEGGILVTDDTAVHDHATLFGHYRDRSRDEVADERLRDYWVTGYGLKLRMSPFNAIVASHSLRNLPALVEQRRRCMNHLRERLRDVAYLEPVPVSPDVDMGAWYGFKPLYRPEALGGLAKDRLIEALRAEGVQVSDPSAPCLATLPLYARSPDDLQPTLAKHVNRTADLPVAMDVQERSLSLPVFSNWERDAALIDGYVTAFGKVGEHHRELLPAGTRR